MYPKKINLKDSKLKKLLEDKKNLITQGRAKSEEIELLESNMKAIDEQIQEAEKKVDITDLDDKAKVIGAKVDEAIKEMQVVKQEIFDRMMAQTPPELRTKYDEFVKQKEEAETERNKIAIKAQKYTDKIIPLGRKLMKPFLEKKGDDYDTIRLEDDEIVASIFNHFDDFETKYDKDMELIK